MARKDVKSELPVVSIEKVESGSEPVGVPATAEPAGPARPPRLASLLSWLAVMAVAGLSLLNNLGRWPVEADEARHVRQARYFWLFWDPASADWHHPDWQARPDHPDPLAHGPVAKYLWGLSLWLHGYGSTTPEELSRRWSAEEHRSAPDRTPEEAGALFAVRLPGAIGGCLACWAIWALTRRVAGLAAATAAGLLLALNPATQAASRHMLFDAVAECWTLWAVVVLAVFYPRLTAPQPRWGAVVLFALVEGVLAGLAVGTKLTGLTALAVCLTVLTLALVGLALAGSGDRPGRLMAVFTAGLCTVITAMATVYVLDPFLADSPIRHFRQRVEYRLERAQAEAQQAAQEGAGLAIAPGDRRAGDILHHALFSHATIRADWLGGWQLNAALGGLGALVLLVKVLSRAANRRTATPLVGLVLAATAGGLALVFLPSHHLPHYLPLASAVGLLEGVGLGFIPDALLTRRTA